MDIHPDAKFLSDRHMTAIISRTDRRSNAAIEVERDYYCVT